MIVLVVEYPCVTCGLALRRVMPIKPDQIPCRLDGVVVPALPDGWTYDAQGVHCPAHESRRVEPTLFLPPGLLRGT